MPKRPRQAHVPTQIRRRKARRAAGTASTSVPRSTAPSDEGAPIFADPPLHNPLTTGGASGPVDTRPYAQAGSRRLDAVRATREGGIRANPGQLPTFERSFIIREIRQIGITSTLLLALIIVLTILLR